MVLFLLCFSLAEAVASDVFFPNPGVARRKEREPRDAGTIVRGLSSCVHVPDCDRDGEVERVGVGG